MQTIELDCAPGIPRPGDLIGGVLEGTGIEENEPIAKAFGLWVWAFPDVSPEDWAAAQPTFKERITALYHAGRIRYGSW